MRKFKEIEIGMINERNFKMKFYEVEPHLCWNWIGSMSKGGYGRIRLPGLYDVYAHRVAFVLKNGYVSSDMVVDHKCRNRRCVNPDHLREVTHRVNSLENSVSVPSYNFKKTHCVNGHEFTPDNIIAVDLPSGHKGRSCATCIHTMRRKFIEKQKLVKRDGRDQYRKYYYKNREDVLRKKREAYASKSRRNL